MMQKTIDQQVKADITNAVLIFSSDLRTNKTNNKCENRFSVMLTKQWDDGQERHNVTSTDPLS